MEISMPGHSMINHAKSNRMGPLTKSRPNLKILNLFYCLKTGYRTLRRFWPPPTPFWPPCIKAGCLSLAEMGSEFVCLANFPANQAK